MDLLHVILVNVGPFCINAGCVWKILTRLGPFIEEYWDHFVYKMDILLEGWTFYINILWTCMESG